MCVVAVAWHAHPQWALVVAGNRDEFHERPALPLNLWPDPDAILAGRDVRAGGTWLGLRPESPAPPVPAPAQSTAPASAFAFAFAVVTNVRTPEGTQPGRPTRGNVVTDAICGRSLDAIEAMNPFNLLHANAHEARVLTNFPIPRSEPLAPGVHGLSNGALGKPWAKTRQLEASLHTFLDDPQAPGHLDPSFLLEALRDDRAPPAAFATDAADHDAIPIFITSPVYGTRCSTVIMLRRDGRGVMHERSFAPDGSVTHEIAVRLPLSEYKPMHSMRTRFSEAP